MHHVAIRTPARFAVPALLMANIALAIGPWLVRIARTEGQVGPIGSGFWRLALAVPFLLIVARRERHEAPLADRKSPIVAALVAGLFFAADLASWHIGILHTRLSNATLFGNVTAILLPLYGFLVLRALPTPKQGLALALAATGGALLIGRSYELAARNLVGDLLCLFAGICYTGYLAAADRARAMLGPWTTLTLSVLASLPVLLGAALVLQDPIWPRVWWPLLLMTLGSQIIGQGLILYAVNRVSSMVIGLMLLVQPIVAAAIGWIIYGEALTLFDFLGAFGIAAALLLVRDSSRPLPRDKIGLSSES